ncbi:HAD family hydrolase [Pseudidiomarina sp.]|uniref:HAD family hydrolase n=1 Tax=Pseudidiomarina sp. TaxID=2081707 RepID=UPI003A97E150
MHNCKAVTVVFDLDDTLYSEREYLKSGVKYLVKRFKRWCPSIDGLAVDKIIASQKPLDTLFEALDLSDSVKQSMLWMYRLHKPAIQLYYEARELIDFCNHNHIDIAVITDGRLVSQSLKLDALGLTRVKSYISEEYKETKPSEGRFLEVQKDFPSKQYIYVGDNPTKDFIAPNQLGWITVGLRYREVNIHTYDTSVLTELQRPSVWVDRLSEVKEIILEANK